MIDARTDLNGDGDLVVRLGRSTREPLVILRDCEMILQWRVDRFFKEAQNRWLLLRPMNFHLSAGSCLVIQQRFHSQNWGYCVFTLLNGHFARMRLYR
jgi:hypothetical protein